MAPRQSIGELDGEAVSVCAQSDGADAAPGVACQAQEVLDLIEELGVAPVIADELCDYWTQHVARMLGERNPVVRELRNRRPQCVVTEDPP